MKKNLLLAALAFVSFGAVAQEEAPEFTVVKANPITSIKNQNQAGTCWCYSSLAFIESELLRMGKGEYDLSEMYIVHNTYLDRADKAVRTHGDVSFSQGGSFFSYNDTKLAQGRDRTKALIADNPELAEELEAKIAEAIKGNTDVVAE